MQISEYYLTFSTHRNFLQNAPKITDPQRFNHTCLLQIAVGMCG